MSTPLMKHFRAVLADDRAFEAAKEAVSRMPMIRSYTCEYHGWRAVGHSCPSCRGGDAPRVCGEHGWAHANKGCPQCAGGQP
jgi:hypothetical protein